MAYFYNSNYSENHDNYQNYDQYYYKHEPRYVHQYSNTEFNGNAYQHAPTPSVVGYYSYAYNQSDFFTSKNANFQKNGEYYYDPVSTEYVVSYNSTTVEEADDVIVEKDDEPKPFHGGYDITKEYGKPLPPSEDICHPPSKIDPKTPSLADVNFESVPSPYLKEDKKVLVSEGEPKKTTDSEVIQEKTPSDFEGDEEDEEFDEDYDEEDEEYDDDYDEELDEEKQDDSGKEPSNLGPIVPLVAALPTKEAQNLEGEAKPKDGSIIGGEVIQEKKGLDLEVNEKEKGKGEGNLDEPNPKNESIGGVIQQEKALELVKEDEDDYQESEGEGEGEEGADLGDEGRKAEDYGNQVRRQIPPGYGMEAFDICEGLFGGYFPCLWKRNQGIYNHQRNVNEQMSDYDYCWKETADYLFGNPNPYGGTMPEKGSYGDPVYSYQRHYPQQPITEQVEYYGGNSSYLQNSRYYYGHNGEY